MQLQTFAAQYCESKRLARTPIYSANRFTKFMGTHDLNQIDQSLIESFATVARTAGVAEETIRGTLKDLRTLVRAATGTILKVVIRKTQPAPEPTPLDHLSAIIPHLAPWSLQWLALSYWTALRLADTVNLQQQISETSVLKWTASKTKWRQSWPVPKWMQKFLTPVSLPYRTCPDWCQVIIRAELDRVTAATGVPKILPKGIRQRSLTEWTRADGAAGAIIHGSGLKILDHYVDPMQILENAMHKVRLPAGLKEDNESGTEETLILSFRRLDPMAQNLVMHTTQRLAGMQ